MSGNLQLSAALQKSELPVIRISLENVGKQEMYTPALSSEILSVLQGHP